MNIYDVYLNIKVNKMVQLTSMENFLMQKIIDST